VTSTELLRDLDPATLRAPWTLYDAWRARGPVIALPELGGWAVTDHALAARVLRDPEGWSSDRIDGPLPAEHPAWIAALVEAQPALRALLEVPLQTLLALDPPDHTRLRRLLVPHLSVAAVRRLAPAVAAHVEALLPGVLGGAPVDFVAGFAAELPLRVVGTLLGLPPAELAAFGALAARASTSNPHRETKASLRDRLEAELALLRRFETLLAGPAPTPPGSLLAGLRAAVRARELTLREAIGLSREVLVAGAETTVDLLSSVVLLLAREPALLGRARDDAAARAALVEEALRLESPFTGFWRRARRATTLGGVALPADALLLVPFGALNRDPAAHREPDRPDLDRPAPRRHLAFGHGIHFCVGAPLARLEAQVALEALLARVERVELLTDPGSLRYRPSIQGRGLEALPVRLVPRPGRRRAERATERGPR